MSNKFLRGLAIAAGLLLSAVTAKADLLNLKIGPAQIFDVQYNWANSSAPNTPNWGCYNDPTPCDVLNVSGLIAPYASTGPGGNFSHPNLTAGQYYGFINSTTNPGTYGMAVFNANGTQAYVIHDTGDLFKMSGDGIFYIGGGFFGTVITPSTGYAYGSSASLNVGTGTPTQADALAYTPPSSGVLTAGQTASQIVANPQPASTPNTSANSLITTVYPTSNNSPATETANKAIDNTATTKYLNFDRTNAGFTVKLSQGKVINGIQFTTANDFEPRDPSKYTLYGSNDGITWTKIVDAASISLSSSRYTDSQIYNINNSNAYVYYFVKFDSIKAIDTYGSVAGCQAALGTLACDSVQVGTVNFMYDNAITTTSTDAGNGTIVNPGTTLRAGTPQVSNGPITTTGPGTSTSVRTPSGVAVAGSPTVIRGTTVTTTSTAYASNKSTRDVEVTRTVTTTRTTPITTNTTWTTPILVTTTTITPTSRNVTTTPVTEIYDDQGNLVNTIYGNPVTTTVTGTQTTVTTSTSSDSIIVSANTTEVISTPVDTKASASTAALSDSIKYTRTNPFLVDVLASRDANWIAPRAAYYSVNGGKHMVGGISFGRQETIENNTVGIAFDASQTDSHNYLNNTNENKSYSGTAYILSKQDELWYKAAVGGSTTDHTGSVKIPQFGLFNSQKAKQNMFYADLGVYSAESWNGFRPLAGVTVVHSQITGYTSTGSALIAPNVPAKTTTQANPYVGVRWEYDKDIGLEFRVTQTRDFKTVGGVRATIKKQIDEDVSIDFIAGADKGSRYNNFYGMVGLTFKF